MFSLNAEATVMFEQERELMQRISNYCGNRTDYVQGGGGNTSVKFDEKLMAIKASGYTLKETTIDKGFVTVDFGKIRSYYNEVDPYADKDFEKESLEVNMDSITLLDGMEKRRPSVEVGMHSFLHRCVIHTHSVYANIICCCNEGRQLTEDILSGRNIRYTFVPYIDPGFRLTLAVKEAAEEFAARNGNMPDVIFMENHGVIVANEDAFIAMALHEQVNKAIIRHLGLCDYPKPKVIKTERGYKCGTQYLLEFSRRHGGKEFFGRLRLYPDQLVYIGKALGDTVEFNGDDIIYNCSEKEANVIEETLLGVAYVVGEIEKAGLTLRQMDEERADFINNWESEKYRSQMVK